MSLRTLRIENCLRRISEVVNEEVESLNSGGCAVFAVELAKRLQAIGEAVNIRVYNYSPVDVEHVERTYFNDSKPESSKEWCANNVHFVHVVVEWGDRLWDSESEVYTSNGERWKGWYVLAEGNISMSAIEVLANHRSNWNPTFDRKQIPRLLQIMDNEFAEFHNEVYAEAA